MNSQVILDRNMMSRVAVLFQKFGAMGACHMVCLLSRDAKRFYVISCVTDTAQCVYETFVRFL